MQELYIKYMRTECAFLSSTVSTVDVGHVLLPKSVGVGALPLDVPQRLALPHAGRLPHLVPFGACAAEHAVFALRDETCGAARKRARVR